MVIASQHPFISWLSGRSNLVARVVVCCTLAGHAIVISSGARGSATRSWLVFIEFGEEVKVGLNGCTCQENAEHLVKLMSLPGIRIMSSLVNVFVIGGHIILAHATLHVQLSVIVHPTKGFILLF